LHAGRGKALAWRSKIEVLLRGLRNYHVPGADGPQDAGMLHT